MTVATINIESDYGYVIVSTALITFQCLLYGFILVGRARRLTFTKEFMDLKFN